MATNQYGQSYSGNDDFRGWLAAGNYVGSWGGNKLDPLNVYAGQNGISNLLLRYVGNDGNIGVDNQNLANLAKQNYDYWQSQRKDQAENPPDNSNQNSTEGATNARMRGIYDQQINNINHNLGLMDDQLTNALNGLKGEYDTYRNEQQSAYDSNKNAYDNSTLQNKQNLQMNRNDITNRASSGLRGLLRVLGSMGAGGGSVARFEAPGMVTAQANQEMSNAGRNYAQNQSNLDTNWGNYQNEFENDKKKLEDWYDGQVKAKKQENYEKRQSLLSDLVSAYGNRAQYGGDYGNNVNDAYNRINSYSDMINNLSKYTPTKYNGMTATYKAPELSSYDTGNMNLITSVANSNTSASAPLLATLQGLNKKKNNNSYQAYAEA